MTIDWQPNETEQKLIDQGLEAEARDLYWVRQLRHHVGAKERTEELREIAVEYLSSPNKEESGWEANFYLTLVALLEGKNPPPRRAFGARLPKRD